MRWLLLALPLALAACSSDPVPVDSGPADTGMVDTGPLDVGPARCTPGLSTTCSCGALGTSTYVCPPSGLAPAVCPCVDVDAALDAPEDRPAPVDAGDAVAVADAPAVDALDAGGADAGADAVADAVALEDVVDVQIVDVGTDVPVDRPDAVAVDVPRDAGAVDGGPVVFDLNEPRATESAVLLMARVCIVGCDNPCDAAVVPGECRLASDGLHFSLPNTPRCSLITGLTRVGTVGTVTVIGSGVPAQSDMTVTVQGASYVAGGASRRNFRVQFSAPRSGGTNGVTGIPGRTVSPSLGDVWLFGCRVE